MKKVLTILLLAGIVISSCQKDSEAPAAKPALTSAKATSSVTTTNQATVVNDTTKGYLRIQLASTAASTATDDILIEFNPASKATYVNTEDAATFAGMGAVSLSSLSSDGVALAINTLPLLSQGTTIGLVVNAKATGVYKLNLTDVSSIPGTFDIWLKDNYKKDSLNFRQYPSYAFNLNTADASTYGGGRFSVVLRAQ